MMPWLQYMFDDSNYSMDSGESLNDVHSLIFCRTRISEMEIYLRILHLPIDTYSIKNR